MIGRKGRPNPKLRLYVSHLVADISLARRNHAIAPSEVRQWVRDKQAGYEQMYRTQSGVAAVTYLAGAFWFAYYDMLVRANWNLESVIGYGATWPLQLLGLV